MKPTWFKSAGRLYLPIPALEILIILGVISFITAVCMMIFRNVHAVSDDIYETFVYPGSTTFWWKWIADKTSY